MDETMEEDDDGSLFTKVPVVDVHVENFREVWPSLILAMSTSTLISLDTELSGLGERKLLQSKSIEDRYKGITETAKTRSILSLGISCFKQTATSATSDQQKSSTETTTTIDCPSGVVDPPPQCYTIQTYNIWTLCEQEYIVEPASLKFLVDHGFDFNTQYAKGVPYYRGADKETDKTYTSLRQLFVEIVRLGKPVALHNGLVDLIFLYQNLYAPVPASMPAFLADLVDLFPQGLFDSKYITDFEHKMPASYLEYVYRKCQRDNTPSSTDSIQVQFPSYLVKHKYVTFRHCALKSYTSLSPAQLRETVCTSYAGHGWCSKGPYCPKSHDIDLILDLDMETVENDGRKRKKRKNKRKHSEMASAQTPSLNSSEQMSMLDKDSTSVLESIQEPENTNRKTSNTELVDTVKTDLTSSESLSPDQIEETSTNQDKDTKDETKCDVSTNQKARSVCAQCSKPMDVSGGHRAGYDAFMTGYIIATYLGRRDISDNADDKVKLWKNKLYLSAKDYPLSVMKSTFAKSSREHLEKISRIRHSNGSPMG